MNEPLIEVDATLSNIEGCSLRIEHEGNNNSILHLSITNPDVRTVIVLDYKQVDVLLGILTNVRKLMPSD